MRQYISKVRNFSPSRFWEEKTGEPLRKSEKIIGIILLAVFLFIFYIALDANKFKTTVHVIEGESKIGLNPTTERIDFGDLSRGTSAARIVNIKNGIPVSVYVVALNTGSISSLVDINRNFFKLHPGEEINMEFSTYMPASALIDKTYDGRVYLFKIPLVWSWQ